MTDIHLHTAENLRCLRAVVVKTKHEQRDASTSKNPSLNETLEVPPGQTYIQPETSSVTTHLHFPFQAITTVSQTITHSPVFWRLFYSSKEQVCPTYLLFSTGLALDCATKTEFQHRSKGFLTATEKGQKWQFSCKTTRNSLKMLTAYVRGNVRMGAPPLVPGYQAAAAALSQRTLQRERPLLS